LGTGTSIPFLLLHPFRLDRSPSRPYWKRHAAFFSFLYLAAPRRVPPHGPPGVRNFFFLLVLVPTKNIPTISFPLSTHSTVCKLCFSLRGCPASPFPRYRSRRCLEGKLTKKTHLLAPFLFLFHFSGRYARPVSLGNDSHSAVVDGGVLPRPISPLLPLTDRNLLFSLLTPPSSFTGLRYSEMAERTFWLLTPQRVVADSTYNFFYILVASPLPLCGTSPSCFPPPFSSALPYESESTPLEGFPYVLGKISSYFLPGSMSHSTPH